MSCRVSFFASALEVSGQVKINFLVITSLTVLDSNLWAPPDNAYTRSRSVKIPTTDDFERIDPSFYIRSVRVAVDIAKRMDSENAKED